MTVWTVLLIVASFRLVEDAIGYNYRRWKLYRQEKECKNLEKDLREQIVKATAQGNTECVKACEACLAALTAKGKTAEERLALYDEQEAIINAGHLCLLKQAARKGDADKERLRVETELKATLETLKARGDLEAVAMRQPLLDAITAEGKNTEERFALYYEEVMKRMEPTERESLKRLLAS